MFFKQLTLDEKNGGEDEDDDDKKKSMKPIHVYFSLYLLKKEETDISYVYILSFHDISFCDTEPSSLTWNREICFKY